MRLYHSRVCAFSVELELKAISLVHATFTSNGRDGRDGKDSHVNDFIIEQLKTGV